ncbi:hypothetical protein SAMD00023353_6500040 [Rosellinia necatrix]|uniref:Uncharacterized protein n=1 Tax=Rosellinia necatrix TaxID=77044 RepID=A0A1S8AAB3_ROSNE|nr:hypothetical protein SAMD00023353_6500040 [Rosellinia necatrix]
MCSQLVCLQFRMAPNRHFDRDIIDTEDANGDVYKMFLGSFIEDFDNKPIQGTTAISTTSGHSATSPTNSLDMSKVSLGEYQATTSPTLLSPDGQLSSGHRQSLAPGSSWQQQAYIPSRTP